MKTKALTAAALIACFTAFSPAMAQTASPQGGTGGGNATSNLPKDGGQNTMGATGATGGSGGSAASQKMNKAGKSDTGRKGGKARTGTSPVANEKSSATDASSTATQGGGASPLNTTGGAAK